MGFVPLSPLSQDVAQFGFCLYTSGAVTFLYGDGPDQFTGTAAASGVVTGSTVFSQVTKDTKFNYGLDAFDVCVQQWDNFGKYLDSSGDMMQTTELMIGSN